AELAKIDPCCSDENHPRCGPRLLRAIENRACESAWRVLWGRALAALDRATIPAWEVAETWGGAAGRVGIQIHRIRDRIRSPARIVPGPRLGDPVSASSSGACCSRARRPA